MLLLESFSNFYKIKLLFLDQLSNWSESHLAAGARQSPIAINEDNIVSKPLPPLQFINYDKTFLPVVINTGKSVKIEFATLEDEGGTQQTPDDLPYIQGGPLEGQYVLKNIHFHWTSEHTIDGEIFPLEGHFVHFKKDLETFEEAKKCEKGFVVLSALYVISKCENSVFEELSEAVQQVCDDIQTPVQCQNEICYKSLLPKCCSSFYSYEGSLTTPDYAENVTWIIVADPGRISRAQYKALTSIVNETYQPVNTNKRELQELNGREIIYTATLLSKIRKSMLKCRRKLFGSTSNEM